MADRVTWIARESGAHLVVDGDVLTLCGDLVNGVRQTGPEAAAEARALCPDCAQIVPHLAESLATFEAVRHG